MHKLNPITRGIWVALLLSGAASGSQVFAAESTKVEQGEEARTTALKTVTVTAQRREETLQEVPVAVSAVDGTSITADGVRAMGDITTFVPNTSAKNPGPDPISSTRSCPGGS